MRLLKNFPCCWRLRFLLSVLRRITLYRALAGWFPKDTHTANKNAGMRPGRAAHDAMKIDMLCRRLLSGDGRQVFC